MPAAGWRHIIPSIVITWGLAMVHASVARQNSPGQKHLPYLIHPLSATVDATLSVSYRAVIVSCATAHLFILDAASFEQYTTLNNAHGHHEHGEDIHDRIPAQRDT